MPRRGTPARFPFAEFRTGRPKILHSQNFVLKYMDNGAGHNRFGIIVSSKVANKAAARNLWKRRLRGIVKNLPNRGKDFLIIASAPIANSTFAIVKKEFESASEKIK